MMSWFDIIVSLVILGAFVRGLQKGLVMQLTRFIAIIISAIFAGKTAVIISSFLLNTINISVNLARVVAYILAFIVIVFIINFIGKIIHSLFKTLHISFINKIMGAIVGVAGAMIVLSILLNLAVMLDPNEEVISKELKSDSFLYSRVQVVVPAVVPYLNKKLWDKYIPDYLKEDEIEEVHNLSVQLHL
ncbi:MAG: CvpA family protein [Dysgonamonadaceae bacterium]|nr:CvpA family protein [Dysgonamonadaceae bacterium]